MKENRSKNVNLKFVAIASTIFLLLFSYVLLYINAQKLAKQDDSVGKTHSFLEKLHDLRFLNYELEYNYNGYIISGRAKLKNAFNSIDSTTSLVLSDLQTVKTINTEQKRLLSNLQIKFKAKIARLQKGFNILESTTEKSSLIQDSLLTISYNAQYAGQITSLISQLENNEQSSLDANAEKVDRFSKAIKVITLISLLIAFALVVLALILYKKNSRERQQAIDESEKYKRQLEDRVEELKSANTEIKELKNLEKFTSTGRIARTIAHEVRNPLTNINLAAEQIKENTNGDLEEQNMLLDMIDRNSKRINELISNLLYATKFSELSQKKISLNEIIDEALTLSKDRLDLKKVQVQKHFDPNICDIELDHEKMTIAFLNLIVNAIEAMEENKGILSVKTEEKNNYCLISFTDNGSGMDTETLNKLFEPFFTSKQNGTGLGLTNTQNIILNHNGKIHAQSTPGKGTTFIVQLKM